jgi:hypothetical protein
LRLCNRWCPGGVRAGGSGNTGRDAGEARSDSALAAVGNDLGVGTLVVVLAGLAWFVQRRH